MARHESTLPPRKPDVQVLVGAPGAGKSTWCAHHAAGTVLSLDAARGIVGAGEDDQSATPTAVAWVCEQAGLLLASGRSVTIDATGATSHDRDTWLRLAREHGATPVATVFRAPLGLCLARNTLRQRQVPTPVLTSMWLSIRETGVADLQTEGFARVEVRISDDAPCPAPDDRDWRHVAELWPGDTIWNPQAGVYPAPGTDTDALEVVGVSEPDRDGMVMVTTTASQEPLWLAADWGVDLYTAADTALTVYVMGLELAARKEEAQ